MRYRPPNNIRVLLRDHAILVCNAARTPRVIPRLLRRRAVRAIHMPEPLLDHNPIHRSWARPLRASSKERDIHEYHPDEARDDPVRNILRPRRRPVELQAEPSVDDAECDQDPSHPHMYACKRPHLATTLVENMLNRPRERLQYRHGEHHEADDGVCRVQLKKAVCQPPCVASTLTPHKCLYSLRTQNTTSMLSVTYLMNPPRHPHPRARRHHKHRQRPCLDQVVYPYRVAAAVERPE